MKSLLLGLSFTLCLTLSVNVYAQIKQPAVESPELKVAISGLMHLLQDSYASGNHIETYDIGDEYTLVLFTLEGFSQGNNHTNFLAVFKKTQRAKLISGETYKHYGAVKYKLVDYLVVGADKRGSLSADGMSYAKSTLTMKVNHGRFGSLVLKNAALPLNSAYVDITIKSHSLTVK